MESSICNHVMENETYKEKGKMVTHVCRRKVHNSGMGCMMVKCMYVCDVCKKCKDG